MTHMSHFIQLLAPATERVLVACSVSLTGFFRFEKHLTIVGLYTAHPPKIPYKINSLLNVVIFRNSPLLMTCNNKLYYSVWCGGSIVKWFCVELRWSVCM